MQDSNAVVGLFSVFISLKHAYIQEDAGFDWSAPVAGDNKQRQKMASD